MKFADEFDENHVPEWRDKYFDYKTGKRLVKAIQQAVHRTNGIPDPRGFFHSPFATQKDGYHKTNPSEDDDELPLKRNATGLGGRNDDTDLSDALGGRIARGSSPFRQSNDSEHGATHTLSNDIHNPPQRRVMFQEPSENEDTTDRIQASLKAREDLRHSLQPLNIPQRSGTKKFRSSITTFLTTKERSAGTPRHDAVHRFPTPFHLSRVATSKLESLAHPIDVLNLREQELVAFLDRELVKVDTFYQQKEREAGKRLEALREQIYILRDRRNEELKGTRFRMREHGNDKPGKRLSLSSKLISGRSNSKPQLMGSQVPFGTEQHPGSYERSDFAKKPIEDTQISYRNAKYKLRVALQEYYRELEYLKSFSLMNRTAFRKLDKKHEKTIHPQNKSNFRWFNNNVEPSLFVTSDLVQDYMEAAEDLYTRYFESGNHKLAVQKLREITKPHGDKSESALINGFLVGIGLVFAVEGVWDGIEKLYSDDEEGREQTAFLLQIYGGYFLMLYLFTWFCICCRVWTAYKVNYPFVFEFDTRHDLDWRQLSNFPCIFWLMFGVTIWLNFAKWWEFGSEVLFLWYPLILVGVTLIVIFLPLPVLRWRSRWWFAVAHWRLLLSGFYPVEFRDFFLGDIYCSLIYAVANAELFFCLYITKWDRPRSCGSNMSRIMGALAAVPPLWRALQCLRRFIDTRNAFPHLANMLKYVLTIGVAIILAMYRIDNNWVERDIYIFLAIFNSLYTSFWDIFMDFSLLQEGARYVGLRDVLAFDMPWMYYAIILVDPILRFGWLPLLVFTHDLQRGTVVAFIVAFAEATRRGMWTLFRVENEHCTNIGSLKASRVIPLPFKVLAPHKNSESQGETSDAVELEAILSPSRPTQTTAVADTPLMEAGQPRKAAGGFKKVSTLIAISRMLAEAHKQDFEKKRGPSEDDVESPALHGTRRDHNIELALREDEDSDDDLEADEVQSQNSDISRVAEEEVGGRPSSNEQPLLEHDSLVTSPQQTRARG